MLYYYLRTCGEDPLKISHRFGIPLPARLEKTLDDWAQIPQVGDGVAYAVDALLPTSMTRRGVAMPDMLEAVEDIVSRLHPLPLRAVMAELSKTQAWSDRVTLDTAPCMKTVSTYCHRLGYCDTRSKRAAVTDVVAAQKWKCDVAPFIRGNWKTVLNADESIHIFAEPGGCLMSPTGVEPKVAPSGGQVGMIFASFL